MVQAAGQQTPQADAPSQMSAEEVQGALIDTARELGLGPREAETFISQELAENPAFQQFSIDERLNIGVNVFQTMTQTTPETGVVGAGPETITEERGIVGEGAPDEPLTPEQVTTLREIGLEAGFGAAGSMFGPIGMVAGTMIGGQVEEFIRQSKGEPATPFFQQAKERGIEGALAGIGEVGGLILAKTAQGGVNIASRVLRRGLQGFEEIPETVQRGREFLRRAGEEFPQPGLFGRRLAVEASPRQVRTGRGFLSVFEDISASAPILGSEVELRMIRRQVNASSAYLDEILDASTAPLDSEEFATFIRGAVKDRLNASRSVRSAAFENVKQIINGLEEITEEPVTFNLEVAARAFTDNSRVPAFNEVARAVRSSFPALADSLVQAQDEVRAISQRLANAKGKARVRLEKDLVRAERNLERSLSAVQEADFETAQTLRSELLKVGRNSKDPAVKDTANNIANDVRLIMTNQMPSDALPVWEAALEFTAKRSETLQNDLIVGIMKRAAKDPDTVLDMLTGPKKGSTIKALREALDKPIELRVDGVVDDVVGPVTSVKGSVYKNEIQPIITNAFLRKMAPQGTSAITADTWLNQLGRFTKTTIDEAFSPGTFQAMKDFGQAMKIAQKQQGSKFGFLVTVGQLTAATALITGDFLIGPGGLPVSGSIAAGAVLLSPWATTQLLTSPKFLRIMEKGFKAGPGTKAGARMVSLLTSLSTQEQKMKERFLDAESVLGRMRESFGGGAQVEPARTQPAPAQTTQLPGPQGPGAPTTTPAGPAGQQQSALPSPQTEFPARQAFQANEGQQAQQLIQQAQAGNLPQPGSTQPSPAPVLAEQV